MKYILMAVIATFLAGCADAKTSDIVSDVRDGVVYITNQLSETTGGAGTGFIINDNQIVTNLHVVDGSGKITVYSDNSERKYSATIVHKDEIADIAVLKLDDWEAFKKNESPVILYFGNSTDMNLGDRIIVIGHPIGLVWSVSEGVISGMNRKFGQNPKFLFQVDADIFHGNSGGPIFDDSGRVVCVSNLLVPTEGGSYGFCIPSDLVKKVLYDFNMFGEVRWRVLNVALDLAQDGSTVLADVQVGGAAEKAGLKKGDKVIAIHLPNNIPGGLKITNPNDLIIEFAKLKGDDENVKLLIERNGELMMIEVKTNFKLSKEYTPDKGK